MYSDLILSSSISILLMPNKSYIFDFFISSPDLYNFFTKSMKLCLNKLIFSCKKELSL